MTLSLRVICTVRFARSARLFYAIEFAGEIIATVSVAISAPDGPDGGGGGCGLNVGDADDWLAASDGRG